jgi:hypothetical protein
MLADPAGVGHRQGAPASPGPDDDHATAFGHGSMMAVTRAAYLPCPR